MTRISDLEVALDSRLQQQQKKREQTEIESLQQLGAALNAQSSDVLTTWKNAMDQRMTDLTISAITHHKQALKSLMSETGQGLSKQREVALQGKIKTLQGKIKTLTKQNQQLYSEARQLRLYVGLALIAALTSAAALALVVLVK